MNPQLEAFITKAASAESPEMAMVYAKLAEIDLLDRIATALEKLCELQVGKDGNKCETF
ncbi:MAG TPA: hypothetical protein VF290_02480 [Pyrinomonadaceae bacterium]